MSTILPKSSQARKKTPAHAYRLISTKILSYPTIIKVAPFGLSTLQHNPAYSKMSSPPKLALNMQLSMFDGSFTHVPTRQTKACPQTRTEPRSVTMHTLGPTMRAHTEHSVLLLALLHYTHTSCYTGRDRITPKLLLKSNSATLMILPPSHPTTGECFSPESTLCADSYSVSVPTTCYCSGM